MNNNTELENLEIILIDNFDSFTYNLVNQLKSMVNSVKVYRNSLPLNSLPLAKQAKSNFKSDKQQIIVLSPGPGNPDSAGITLEVIERYKGVIPIMGICLGHQAIIQNYGGVIGAAKSIIHGKTCDVHLDSEEQQIFAELETPFRAARYHSLAAAEIPDQLKVIATSENDVMAVKHQTDKVLGFQFHPESILTPKGDQLIKQSLLWLLG